MASRAKATSHWPLTLLGGTVSILNLLLPLALVRVLSQTEIGHYKTYFLYLPMIPLLCLSGGIGNGLSHWAGYEREREGATQASWTLLVLLALVVCGVAAIFDRSLSSALGWDLVATRLLIWGAAVTILGTFFDDASIAGGAIVRGAIFNAGFDLARNLLMAAAVLKYRTIEALFWTHNIVMTLKVLSGAIWGWAEGFQRFTFRAEIWRRVLSYAFPVSVAVALGVVTAYADQIIMTKLLLPQDFAVYALGCLSVPPLLILEQSVNRVLIPRLAKAFAQGRPNVACKLFRDGISELSWLLLPATCGLVLFASPIVSLLFTKQFAASTPYLRIFALSYAFLILPYDAVPRARGHGAFIFRLLGAMSIVTLTIVGFAAWRFGPFGAICAATFVKFILRVVAVDHVRRSEGWTLRQMLPWRDWAHYVSVCAVASAGAIATRTLVHGDLHWFVAGGLTFSTIYFAGTILHYKQRRSRTPVLMEALQNPTFGEMV